MIPDEALEAAVTAHCEGTMRAALEAALPILLSHEREETRLAHLDAVVNAQTVDRLEGELEQAKAEAWDEGHAAGRDYQGDGWNSDAHNPTDDNPYRTPGVGA